MTERLPSLTVLRATPRLVWILLLVIALGYVFFLSQPSLFVVQYLNDDAFYYFQIAANIVQGHGSTFDRLNPTNGYHPFWMLVLLPVYILFGSRPEIALRAALVVQLGMWLFFSALLFGVLVKRLKIWAWLPALLLWLNPWFFYQQVNGMESAVALVFLVLLVWVLEKRRGVSGEAPVGADFRLGFLLGLAYISRLDTSLVSLGVFILLMVRRPGKRLAAGAAFLAGAAVPALSYHLWNVLCFGRLTPVSMHLKHRTFDWSVEAVLGVWKKVFWPIYLAVDSPFAEAVILLGLVGVALFVVRLRKLMTMPDGNPSQGAVVLSHQLPFLVGVALHWVYLCVFSPSRSGKVAFNWYWAPEMVAAVIVCGGVGQLIYDWMRGSMVPKIVSVAGSAFFLAVSVFSLVFFFGNVDRYRASLECHKAGLWLHHNTPEDAVIGCWDAGKVGYFSERNVLNLDGLVSSFEYLENYKKHGRLADWLDRNSARFLTNYYAGDRFRPAEILRDAGWILEPVYTSTWDQVPSNPANPPTPYRLTIWRLSPPAEAPSENR